uniref:Uncharacterized protein n=1 Tax=Rhizophora mucronata TaxID=61149 RepID=A0A2P2IHW4_RHIMU
MQVDKTYLNIRQWFVDDVCRPYCNQ